MNRRTLVLSCFASFSTVLFLSLITSGLSGCGQPAESAATNPQVSGDQSTKVKGTAEFSNQCPYGTTSQAYSAKFDLESCNVPGLQKLELAHPMETLELGADCVKKTLTIRTADRQMDSTWEVLPDNTFNVAIPGNSFSFVSDGAGHSNCTAPTILKMWGKLDCPANPQDIEKVSIKVEALWYLDQTDPTVHAPPITNQCVFPSGCFLHTIKEVGLCS